jgi:hypothetical protein
VKHVQFTSQRGTVILVALCFVVVLGISLAGYLAACSRAMQLSNRTFQTGTSQQLAEIGLEEALRAFNKNDWSNWSSNPTNVTSGAWSFDSTYNRASRTITFDAGKLGQGATGTIKMRIDNYNAAQLGSTWSSTVTYELNDLVGYSGVWYRSVQNTNLSHTPSLTPGNLSWWVPEPIPWAWSSYTDYRGNLDVICNAGTWYRCTTTHTSGASFAVGSNWSSIPAPVFSWATNTSYTAGTFLYNGGSWYRCLATHTSTVFALDSLLGRWTLSLLDFLLTPNISWSYRTGGTYSYNDVVYYNGTWYRYINSSSGSGNVPTNTTYWEPALTGSMAAWSNGGIKYNLGDTVYYNSAWYRCLLAHTSSASLPPNTSTAYWATTPLYSMAWQSSRLYNRYDTVRYNGAWYLSLQDANTGRNPVTGAAGYWETANSTNGYYLWSASTAYDTSRYVCYGGAWYHCLVANTGQSPNNTTYWSATWAQASGATTGTPVIYAEGTVNTPGNPPVTTQLRATIAPAPLFPNAMASSTTLSANSGGTVDSYDSDTGVYGGSNIGYSAVVAAGNTASTAITLSSAAVKGYLAAPSASSSPYAPLYSTGGTVKGASSPATPNVDLSRISRSPYIPKFDTLPGGSGGLATNWSTTPKGTPLALTTTTVIGTPGATTPARYYYNGNLTIGTATINILRIVGPVILYVNGDLFVTASGSTGRIELTSTGSAEIHVAGAFKADVAGEGILSRNTNPRSLIIICDTTSTADHYYNEGVNPFYGVIYVPYTTSTNGYYNSNSTNIYGAISANKITYSGSNLNVHYDAQLRYATFGGVDQPYAITEWRELTGAERATMP